MQHNNINLNKTWGQHDKFCYKIMTLKERFDAAVKASGVNYAIDKSISGYYRLIIEADNNNYELVIDDSAYEDFYDEDSAIVFFTDYICEQHGLNL